jgi:hypothetical protein
MAGITQVIKSEDNGALIRKYPGEDFNTLTQLIVHESQEAGMLSDEEFEQERKKLLETL